MNWKNNAIAYGSIAIFLHWLVALTVITLFGLGLWMTELDYYHSWYELGPWLHKSVGILLFLVVLFRLIWRFFSPPPAALKTHKKWEVKVAHLTHRLIYILLLLIMASGYLISTADNRAIDVLNWFSVPATITSIPGQADVAGWIHFILASSLIGLVSMHALAALKHHFIDRDHTLKRILGR